jgi:hypothetical protein
VLFLLSTNNRDGTLWLSAAQMDRVGWRTTDLNGLLTFGPISFTPV